MYGAEVAWEIIQKNKDRPILVYYDADVDGVFAGFIASKWLDSQGLKYQYYINPNRTHGFKLNVEKLKGYLVIAVDFEIDTDKVQELVLNDVCLVSLDHHKIQDDFVWYQSGNAEGCIINNQYPFEPMNKGYLSGAGVVYEFFCQMDKNFENDELKALVGITLLSDVRPIENDLAKDYLRTVYNIDTTKGYMRYLMETLQRGTPSYGFGMPRFDRNFIDFTFSPTINALLRFGREQDALNFIMGGGLPSDDVRGKQKKLIELMSERKYFLELDNLKVVSCDEDMFQDCKGINISNFIGYLASKEKGVNNSVLAFTYKGNEVTRASFRGRYDDIDYNKAFQSLGVNAQGHKGAFGIVDFKPTDDIWEKLDKVIGELNKGHRLSATIMEVSNISVVMVQQGMKLAEKNSFVRDEFRTYLRYTGTDSKLVSNNSKYFEYLVNGMQVKGFDPNITPENGLLLPMLEKNHVKLYLREMIK